MKLLSLRIKQKDGFLKINILSSFTHSDVVPNPCPTRKKDAFDFQSMIFFVSHKVTLVLKDMSASDDRTFIFV